MAIKAILVCLVVGIVFGIAKMLQADDAYRQAHPTHYCTYGYGDFHPCRADELQGGAR